MSSLRKHSCAVVSDFGSGGKLAVFLLWWEIFITTGKKKDTVVCLAGARSLLRPEKKRFSRLSVGCAVLAITTGKKKIQSSVWRVRDHYYDRKKKIQSSVCWVRGSGDYDRKKKIQSSVCWVRITTGKKKIQSSVCWVRGSGNYDRKKKRYSRLSDGLCCCIVFCSGGKFLLRNFITTGKKACLSFLSRSLYLY